MTRTLSEWLRRKDDQDLRMYDFSEEHSAWKAWLIAGIIVAAGLFLAWLLLFVL
ncbi:MAG TPA: hypothetical protein VMT44_00955 [Methanoregula sp.]|nr:hypothetical protein [Methanoregula sp.]